MKTYKDTSCKKSLKCKSKFEEDIVLPFRGAFSKSSTLENGKCKSIDISKYSQISETFPDIDAKLAANTEISAVRDQTVHQLNFKGIRLTFSKKSTRDIALVVWRNMKSGKLILAELTFKLKSKTEQFGEDTIENAHKFYIALENEGLKNGWVTKNGTTKTLVIFNEEWNPQE